MNALVLCAGSRCSDQLLFACCKKADFVICADGALDWVLEKGVKIDLFVGDMDSVSSQALVEGLGCEVVKLPVEKDMTDGEFAAGLAVKRGAKSLVMLGALGGRLDHALGNIQVLVGLRAAGVDGLLVDDATEVRVIDGELTLSGEPGQLLSLIPLGEHVVVAATEGLYYPLQHSHLRLDQVRGVSNVFTEKKARIRMETGYAAVIAERRPQ